MAQLKLNLAPSGLALSIPSRSLQTVEGVRAGRFADMPNDARCASIRYLVGSELRTRAVLQTFDAVFQLMAQDKVARTDWIKAEMGDGEMFAFLPEQVLAVEGLDPEAAGNDGCSAMVDLLVVAPPPPGVPIREGDGVPLTGLKIKADPDELMPASPAPHPPEKAKARGGRRQTH